jgi:hypothetical protein
MFALRDFARHLTSDPFVRRPVHQAQHVADSIVREHLDERRLLQRDGQRHLQRAIEHRLARRVHEVREQDRVLLGQRIRAPSAERREEHDSGHHGGEDGRCDSPVTAA